jgi:hypothetical protein
MIEDCDKEIAPQLGKMEAKVDVSQKPAEPEEAKETHGGLPFRRA